MSRRGVSGLNDVLAAIDECSRGNERPTLYVNGADWYMWHWWWHGQREDGELQLRGIPLRIEPIVPLNAVLVQGNGVRRMIRVEFIVGESKHAMVPASDG